MANVLSLALKITADATGLKLDPVQRALVGLGDQADKLTAQFDQFAAGSGAAAAAQAEFAARSQELINTLRDNGSATQFAASFEKLSAEARELAVAFAEGQRITEANRTEEEKRAITLAKLNDLLDKGAISQDVFNRAAADASGANADAARAAAEAAQVQAEAARVQAEGQRVTEANRTEEERRAITLTRLNELFDQGAISQETFNRATAEASGANAEAARAAAEAAQQQAQAAAVQADALRQRQALEARAASIINANLTAQERYEQSLRELNDLQRQGLLTQEQYNRAVAAARAPLDAAAEASARVAEAGTESALRFNELSGVFAILPGPLGNIAGRLSGLTSAGEGLSRVFAGGLKQGIASIGQSIAGLVNPFTIAAAGVVGFAAAAASVAQGLIALEDRVERLSRLATQLGISFEFVQTLEEAGKRADVSIEQLSGSFARLQNTLAGADEESKKAATALERLGVSVTEFGELSQEQQIELIGEKLSQIEDPAQRSAAAIALFGRSGVQLLPFFNELELAATDMERFGRAVTDLDQQRLAAFGGGLDALNLAASGLGTSLLLPFTGLGEGISFALAEITAGITAIVDPIGRILEPLLTQIGRNIEFLGTQLGNVGRVIGAVFEPFADIVQEVFVALEPLLDGILDFLKGVSDAAVATVEWFIAFTPVGQIAENVGALGETISRVVTIITTAFSLAGDAVSAIVSRFGEFVAQSPLLAAIGNTLSSVFGSISSVFSTIAEAIGGVVGRLLRIAENFLGIDRSAQASAKSAASVGDAVERTAKQTESLEKAYQSSGTALNSAISKAGEFGQAGFDAALEFQQAIADLQEQADALELDADQYARGVALATEEFEKQIAVAKQVAEENQKLAEAAARRAQAEADAVQKIIDANLEQQRIEQDFGGDSGRFRAAQDLLKVTEEISRVEESLLDARLAGDSSAVDLAKARLNILRPVEANLLAIEQQLADSADEIAQGFTDGFDKAFAATATSLDPLIDKASEFGNEGARAAQELQQGIEELQERVRDGILGRPAYEAELAAQKELFNQRIADLDAIAERERQQREAQFNAQVAANNRLQAVLNVQVPQRAAEAAGIQALERQKLAAENLIAIENQIALTRQGIDAAREQGDLRSAAARNNELKLLQDLAKQEKAIIDGKEIDRQKSRDFLAEQSRAAQAQQQAAERGRQQQEQQRKEQEAAQAEIEKARQEEFNRQTDRLRQLNSIGQQSINSGDIRSSEGASAFVRAAAGQFDPVLAELRSQNKILNTIAVGLARNLAALTGTPTNLGVFRV